MRRPCPHHLLPGLLQLQVRHHLGEGRLRNKSEVGCRVSEVLIKAGGEGADKELVGDRLAKITKLIGKLFEAHAKIVNGRVKLLAPIELAVKMDLALKFVVGEETVELGPDSVSIILVAHHLVEEVLGDGEVEPADDGGVEDHPLLVVHHKAGVHGAIDVTVELVLTKHQGEVRLPSTVGGGGLIEDHRDAIIDVEITNEGEVRAGEGVAAGGDGGVQGIHGGGVAIGWKKGRRGDREGGSWIGRERGGGC